MDGVIEINQAAVLAAGGFPYQITTSGSYRLTGPLDMTGLSTILPAIVVGADDVTLDLNGFRILGPCPGGVTCTPTGTGVGILASGTSGLLVRNGIVEGMAGNGVTVGDASRLERLRIFVSGQVGISGGTGVSVIACDVLSSGAAGISIASRGSVAESFLRYNAGNGIEALSTTDSSLHVRDSFVLGNGAAGIHLAGPSALLERNTVSQNGADGILAAAGARVTDNSAVSNIGSGIVVGEGAHVSGNVTRGNGNDGIRAGPGCRIEGNATSQNGDDGIQTYGGSGCMVLGNYSSDNPYGLYLNSDTIYSRNAIRTALPSQTVLFGVPLGPNVCNGVASCP